MELTIKKLNAAETRAAMDKIVPLRNRYFMEWPYGHADHEEAHMLFVYRETMKKGFVAVAVYDGDQMIGIVTGHEEPDEQWPAEYENHFYRGWVAIEPSRQREGILTIAIDAMWNMLIEAGYPGSRFLAVDAEKDGYQPIDYFRAQGYTVLPQKVELGGFHYWLVVRNAP